MTKITQTVSYTLIMTAFGIVSNPDVEEKLYRELREAFPDPNELCLSKLEKLPYLVSDPNLTLNKDGEIYSQHD